MKSLPSFVRPSTPSVWLALFGLSLPLGACATEPSIDDPLTFEEAPVSAVDPIFDGAPGNDALEEENKADEVLPMTFDLMDIMTPVRSQGSRGTCTIFATAALMESLYRAEGTIASPDFSEQFLQWSSKVEGMSFPTSEGSNPNANLTAISRFGIVEETLWPYENQPWGASNDMLCTGEERMRPVRCFTNGEPPATALAGTRYRLPAGRWINSRRNSLMSYMVNNRLPVVVSGDFFYQAWNHGGSRLPVNASYSRRGIVMYPTAEDLTDSRMRPAGHGILLLGFDQNMEVARLDGMGQPVLDAMGMPVMERGFFLFKNSWGTGRFGTENPMGAGYGWISMRYIEEYMTAYVSARPTLPRVESCNNRSDDDRDGDVDCDDSDCSADRACMDMPTTGGTTASPMVAIPDNSTTGASSTITVAEAGVVTSVAVTVDITHTYRGDLRLELTHGSTTVTLVDRVGAGADNLQQTFTVADFNNADATGPWVLRVVDTARADTGTLNTWSIAITRCMGSCGGTETSRHYENTTAAPIPDNSTAGVSREITITEAGTVRAMSVSVDITHEFPYDLTVRLSRVGGREFTLLRQPSIDGPAVAQTFTVEGFVGEMAPGTYRLTVVDGAARDVGTLNRWSMDVTSR
jgi:subtilisin-like proprotein convertase family protein